MKLLDTFKQAFTFKRKGVDAATVAPVPLPKAPTGAQSLPGYRTQMTARTSAVPKPNVNVATLD